MSVVSFFLFWHCSGVGRIQPWESGELAPISGSVTDILCDSGQETRLQPHTHYGAGPGGREAQGFVKHFSIPVFHQITRLSSRQCPRQMSSARLP